MVAPADIRDPVQAASEAAVVASLTEPERFAVVYDAYYGALHRYIAARLGPDASEDVAAEVFLTAFKERRRFDPSRGRIRPWLFGIATNLIGRHSRAERRRYARLVAGEGAEAVFDTGFEEQAAERIAAQRLRPQLGAALAALKKPDRDVLLLIGVAGLSYAEAGEALSIAPGTVASRLNRARTTVRRFLEPELTRQADENMEESDG